MTIAYPLTPPTNLTPSSVRWSQINVVAVSPSPYTLQTQVHEYDGEGWGLQVSLDPMDRATAAPWIAFLAALRGRFGTFWFGDTLMKTPLGNGGGIPLVNGASQTGKSLVTDGWPTNTAILKASDLFQIDQKLYMSLTDVNSDSSGNATIDVWPRLRTHADNAALVLDSPRGVFRLSDNQQPIIDAGRNSLFNIEFTAEEAL